jgi:hypothetical protein
MPKKETFPGPSTSLLSRATTLPMDKLCSLCLQKTQTTRE